MPMTLTNLLAMDLHSLTEMDNYCLQTYKLKTYFACYCISTFHLSLPAKEVHVYLPSAFIAFYFYNVSAWCLFKIGHTKNGA